MEVKCLYRHRIQTVQEAVAFCPCNVQSCDFVVWTPQSIYVERVEKDGNFIDAMVERLSTLWKSAIFPELLRRRLENDTIPPPVPSSDETPPEVPGSSKTCRYFCENPGGGGGVFYSDDKLAVVLTNTNRKINKYLANFTPQTRNSDMTPYLRETSATEIRALLGMPYYRGMLGQNLLDVKWLFGERVGHPVFFIQV